MFAIPKSQGIKWPKTGWYAIKINPLILEVEDGTVLLPWIQLHKEFYAE